MLCTQRKHRSLGVSEREKEKGKESEKESERGWILVLPREGSLCRLCCRTGRPLICPSRGREGEKGGRKKMQEREEEEEMAGEDVGGMEWRGAGR